MWGTKTEIFIPKNTFLSVKMKVIKKRFTTLRYYTSFGDFNLV